MLEHNNNAETSANAEVPWLIAARGEFKLLVNQQGERELWLDLPIYQIEAGWLDRFMHALLQAGVIQDGNAKMQPMYTPNLLARKGGHTLNWQGLAGSHSRSPQESGQPAPSPKSRSRQSHDTPDRDTQCPSFWVGLPFPKQGTKE